MPLGPESRGLPRIEESSWDAPVSEARPQTAQTFSYEKPAGKMGAAAVKVSIARQVSLSRRTPVQKPIKVKQALKPQVVDMRERKSTLVTIEDA